jgi:adenosine deaminase
MSNSIKITEDFIRELPKTELHCHLDGSLRLETMLDLAAKNKVNLPTNDKDTLKKMVCVTEQAGSLPNYLKIFDLTLKVLQTPDSLTRTAYELAEDCARENIIYLEVRYSPILHTDCGMTTMESVDAVLKGLKMAEQDFKIKTGIIICGIRSISPEVSYQLAELAVAFKNRGVVGFDLAGVEENFPAKDHREAFNLILQNNINTPARRGKLRSGIHPPGRPLLRSASHRSRCPSERRRRPAQLYQRSPDHSRNVPDQQCANRQRKKLRIASVQILFCVRPARNTQYR